MSATGQGSNPAGGIGGGVELTGGSSHDAVVNSTLASNGISGKASTTTGTASAVGGGLFADAATVRITNVTVARNTVAPIADELIVMDTGSADGTRVVDRSGLGERAGPASCPRPGARRRRPEHS